MSFLQKIISFFDSPSGYCIFWFSYVFVWSIVLILLLIFAF